MTSIDYLVLSVYLVGTLAVSIVVSVRNKSADDMFVAGGQSPWWASGLSGFMTMFSAGTFVVWGGIAYKYGAVAIAINLCYGIAALAVGFTVAGRWNAMGIRTPAEFIDLRFGRRALHFYTATMMAFKIIGTAVAVYALSVIMTDAMPLGEGNPLRDARTGNLSLTAAIVLLWGLIVLYTVVGGLWGVLMTDVLQFIVLNLAVLFVVPLAISRAGGLHAIAEAAPEGFFRPTGGGYTWWFLAGWVAIHYFVVGAEWAFVQRFLCVSSPCDAKKGVWLFGALYLISPFVWFAPPMAYRAMAPIPEHGLPPALLAELGPEELSRFSPEVVQRARDGDLSPLAASEVAVLRDAAINQIGERAYARVCHDVLPVGMMGMMLAAMFSATASGASGILNVFAGVLTYDVYARFRQSQGKPADERELVRVGRFFTVMIGVLVVGLALAIPRLGGAERVIVAITSFMTVPLLAPVLWGLASRRINATAVWATAAVTAAAALATMLLAPGGALAQWPPLRPAAQWIAAHARTAEIMFGVGLPVATLACIQLVSRGRGVSAGARRVDALTPINRVSASGEVNREMASIVGWSTAASAAIVALLVPVNDESRGLLAGFALLLALLSIMIFRATASMPANATEGSHVEA